jgi:hypothetical protein
LLHPTALGGKPEATMSRVYFHLTLDGEYFPDPIGEQVSDLTAAHSRAVLLAGRVMSSCELEAPRTERGVVTIEDDTGRVLLSVIVREERHPRCPL